MTSTNSHYPEASSMASSSSMHYDDSKHSYSNPGLQLATSSRAAHEQRRAGQQQRSNSSNGGGYPHHRATSALGNNNSRSLSGA